MLKPFPNILFRSPLHSLRSAFSLSPNISSIFEEGLYLSSPEFWQEFQKREQLNGKEREKLELSFSKYWLRSAARCTPYGTFAGSAMAAVSDKNTSIVMDAAASHRRSLRLDMNYMAEIVNALVQRPEIRNQICFIPNNSIYAAANTYRYAEYHIQNNTRSYQLTSVDQSPYLEKILHRSKDGASLQDLVGMLIGEDDIPETEAVDYVTELWLSQLLIPVLEPAVTGREPLTQVIEQLEKLSGVDDVLGRLKEILFLLNHPEEGVLFYKRIEEKLAGLDPGIKASKNTVQADLFLNTISAEINEGLVNEIVAQADDLKALARQFKNVELEDFKSKFYARYENAQIPLSVALDADMGIGYAGVNDQSAGTGEWVDGLAIAGGSEGAGEGTSDYLRQLSLTKYHDWIANGKTHIEISEEDIRPLKKQTENYKFPNSMFLMGSLMKHNGQLDKDHFVFDISSFGGPSAANLFGRFTHGHEQLAELTKDLLKKEEQENPDAAYAEIAHLPQARIGNILLRPVLRNYEIPYVGLSGMPRGQQITIDDLFVSVKHNEIVLWSKRLNKKVIPRLTTAHNFGYNSLPVYKFLCDLQGQGNAYANVWDWGSLSTLKHLPRVTYKNLILQKATWKIEEKEIDDLPKDQPGCTDYFDAFRDRLKMPQRVVYKEGDNELLIDFTEEKGTVLFIHYLRRYKNIVLEEFLFTDDNCIVHDAGGNSFTNEMIVPLYEDVNVRTQAVSHRQAPMHWHRQNQARRTFSPYSEWLYFKVYCGPKSAEKLLASIVLPFVEEGVSATLFEKFFFIRYKDEGGHHFRIRFFNKSVEKQLPVYQNFMQALKPYIENGTVNKVTLDTYNRELERYLPELIEEAETIFYGDSLVVLRFISLLDGVDGEQYRMLFAMRGIDMMLDDFGFNLQQKLRLGRQLQGNFFNEFGAHPALQKQLNDRYRKHQQFFVNHFDASKDHEHEIDEAVSIFTMRSEMNRAAIHSVLNHLHKADDADRIYDLLASYIHMFLNRLFIAQQRKHELVVYHFLERYYTSKVAILKRKKEHAVPLL